MDQEYDNQTLMIENTPLMMLVPFPLNKIAGNVTYSFRKHIFLNII